VSASPVSVSDRARIVTVTPADGDSRSFIAERFPRTWDNRRTQCLYAGSAQGGRFSEYSDPSLPSDSVIEGTFRSYQVDSLFDSEFIYREFESNRCGIRVIDPPQ